MISTREAAFRRVALSSVLIAAFGGAQTHLAHAEDIDIYGAPTIIGQPNLVFLLDNTSNWSSNNQGWNAKSSSDLCPATPVADRDACRALVEAIYYEGVAASVKRPWEAGYSSNISLTQGQVQTRALRLALNSLVCTGGAGALRINVGLALLSKGTAGGNGESSGVINFAVRPMAGSPTDASTNCGKLNDRLKLFDANINAPTYKAPSNANYGAAMYEIFKYFGGYSNPSLTGPSTSTAGAPIGATGYGSTRFSSVDALDDVAAFTSVAKTTYLSPITVLNNCARSFMVLVGNSYPNAEPNGPAKLSGLSYTSPVLPADSSRFADEWASFLAKSDISPIAGNQAMYTYALNVYKDKPDAAQATLMRSIAANGGAGPSAYIEVGGDITKLVRALADVVTNVAAVNSVFSATTLPVSTTTQGSYLNQLFVGMFRPDANGKPRWVGNLKQYKLGLDGTSGDLSLVDSNGVGAVLQGSGFFKPGANSFWTTDSVFFSNFPSGTPLSGNDNPDGQIVEKGGVAERLRKDNAAGSVNRKVFTAPATISAAFALSAQPFTSSNANVTSSFSAQEIAWVRGENSQPSGNTGAEPNGSYMAGSVLTDFGATGPRTSIHGDVLHSRPVALNYGGGRVVVFYGSNDGMLRAVEGSQTSVDGGKELWSFVAPEHYAMLKRQFSNTPDLFLPSSPTSDGGGVVQPAGTQKKDYAFDGPISSLVTYNTAGTVVSAKIFVAMRRGGRAVYAFDVTDPAAPRLIWKIDPSVSGYDQTVAQGLGQTWSTPRAVIFPPSVSSVPLIIMGGGYDATVGENQGSSPFLGGSVFVINANTGALVRRLTGFFSMPSDVTLVDTNFDGVIDRGYTTDVKGIVYRITMHDAAGVTLPPASWSIKKIANLQNRTYFAPDVVVANDFIAVLQGTGNREQPLVDYTDDGFYLLKDKKIGQVDRVTELFRADLTRIARVDGATDEIVDIVDGSADPEGCWIQLSRAGEKVVNAPFSIAGATYFGTNRPISAVGSCTGQLGKARAYTFPLFCGKPTAVNLDGGGLPPSPVGGMVTVNVNGVDTLVPFVVGAGVGGSAFEVMRPKPPITPVRRKTFWRIDNGNR